MVFDLKILKTLTIGIALAALLLSGAAPAFANDYQKEGMQAYDGRGYGDKDSGYGMDQQRMDGQQSGQQYGQEKSAMASDIMSAQSEISSITKEMQDELNTAKKVENLLIASQDKLTQDQKTELMSLVNSKKQKLESYDDRVDKLEDKLEGMMEKSQSAYSESMEAEKIVLQVMKMDLKELDILEEMIGASLYKSEVMLK